MVVVAAAGDAVFVVVVAVAGDGAVVVVARGVRHIAAVHIIETPVGHRSVGKDFGRVIRLDHRRGTKHHQRDS